MNSNGAQTGADHVNLPLDFAELYVHHAEGLKPHRRQDLLRRDDGAVQKKYLVRERRSHTLHTVSDYCKPFY